MPDKIPIVALDDSGALVHWFESYCDAKRAGWDIREIAKCIKGPLRRIKRYKGLTWKLASEVNRSLLPVAPVPVDPPAPPPAPKPPDPLATFIAEHLHEAPGHLIPFADFYARFMEWLPVDERPDWSKIRVSRCLPLKFQTGKGTASKVFLINAAWEPCNTAGLAYVVTRKGRIRRQLTILAGFDDLS